jgi:DNA-binding transcriptional ArsR family regulator
MTKWIDAISLRAKFFRGLADPSRLAVLLKLRTGEKTVTMISEETGFSLSKVSNYLACLKECGLVLNRQDYYCIADEKILDLLSVADEVIANNTERIIECVNYCDHK